MISPTRAALLVAAICATAQIAHASCPDGTPQAACVLHEEGVTLLTSKRYEEAAAKFRAAIASAPSARSYLGYSQAVEGQGRLALAYETMLVAQRLSNEEMTGAGAKDPANIGRAERIKYKLGELAGRVGFVWLRLPEGVPPQRLVSIHREGEGDLPSPLGRWVTVGPNQQLLIATLDDGTQLQVVAKIAPGSQSTLVIPIPARAAQPVGPQPVGPQPLGPQPPAPGMGRPLASLYEPRPTPPLPSTSLGVGLTFLSSGAEVSDVIDLGVGVGLFGLFERRVGRSLGLTFRADYVSHASSDADGLDASFTGYELMTLAGIRTMSRTLHVRFETGVTVSTVDGSVFLPEAPPMFLSTTDVYPTFSLGGGLQLGRIRIHANILYALNPSPDDAPQMPARFMASFGYDLWRR